MNGIPLRPMSGGELLDRAFQLYRSRFSTMLVVGVVFYMPMALAYSFGGAPAADLTSGWIVRMMAMFLVAALVGMACAAAMTQVADGAVGGRDIGVAPGLGTGLKLVPRLVGLVILTYLLGFGAMIPGGVVAAVLVPAAGAASAGAVRIAVLLVGGSLCFVILLGGLVWWCGISMLSLPVLVGENLGPLSALKRANVLARGARVRIAGLGVLAWLIMVLPMVGISFMLGLGSALIHPELAQTASAGLLYTQRIISVAVGALTLPYLVAVLVLLYYDRRVRCEGYDIEVATAALESRQ